MPDNIAFRYVQAFRASRLHFQNGLHFFVYGNDVSGKRDGVFKNRTNNAVIVNKEHIQRHRRVSHPHTDLARRFENAGVSAIIYTDISRDGVLQGPNLEATAALAEQITTPVIVSGGISSLEDIRECRRYADRNIAGVIAGRAIYEKRFTVSQALSVLKGE